jgi:ABC-2 type transport system permease protein
MGLLKSLTRLRAQVSKELRQVRRRPGALLSLVLGPFLVMALFGLGYTGVRQPLQTAVIMPAQIEMPREPAFYEELAGPAIRVVSVTEDAEWARGELAAGRVDAVISLPADVRERFRRGERAEIEVLINEVDPITASYAGFLADIITAQLNREILTSVISEGEGYLIDQLDGDPLAIPPEVLAQPTQLRVTNTAATQPLVVTFFAPAVLALVLQHMAVTLTALSFVRERTSGILEIFRVSPVTTTELVLGKYIGLGIVSAVVALVSIALLVFGLGVPQLGDPLLFGVILFLLTFASLGVGLLISVVADSERQAVQLSLLVLLASVFFSGFVLPVSEFTPMVRGVSYSLPVTHGISLLTDVMLRGGTQAWWQVTALAAIGLILFVLTTLLLRRTVRAT